MSVMTILAFCFLFGILVLRAIEAVSPFPDIPIQPLDYEEVTPLLSRQSSLEEMSNIMY